MRARSALADEREVLAADLALEQVEMTRRQAMRAEAAVEQLRAGGLWDLIPDRLGLRGERQSGSGLRRTACCAHATMWIFCRRRQSRASRSGTRVVRWGKTTQRTESTVYTQREDADARAA